MTIGTIADLDPVDTAMSRHMNLSSTHSHVPMQMYPEPVLHDQQNTFHFPASPNMPAPPMSNEPNGSNEVSRSASNGYHSYGGQSQIAMPSSELDTRYWNNMFRELGFGDNIDSTAAYGNGTISASPYGRTQQPYTAPLAYHHMQASVPGYGP